MQSKGGKEEDGAGRDGGSPVLPGSFELQPCLICLSKHTPQHFIYRARPLLPIPLGEIKILRIPPLGAQQQFVLVLLLLSLERGCVCELYWSRCLSMAPLLAPVLYSGVTPLSFASLIPVIPEYQDDSLELPL